VLWAIGRLELVFTEMKETSSSRFAGGGVGKAKSQEFGFENILYEIQNKYSDFRWGCRM
jgi:hypothetical protein